MPSVHSPDEQPRTYKQVMADQHTQQDVEANKALLAKHRAERRGMKRINVQDAHSSLPGDHTDNTPPLRRDAKFRNKLDLPAHPYKTTPYGVCVWIRKDGSVDTQFTLAILQHYRHIIASRQQTHEMKYRRTHNDA